MTRAVHRISMLVVALAAAGCGEGSNDRPADAPPAPPLEPGGWVLRATAIHGNTGATSWKAYIDGSGYLDFVWPDSMGDYRAARTCAGTLDAAAIGELTDMMNDLGLLSQPDTEPPGSDVGSGVYSVLATTGPAAGLSNGVTDYLGVMRPLGDAMIELADAQTECIDL